MNVTPLALRSPRAVRDTLRRHGWAESVAGDAAGGLGPLGFHCSHLTSDVLEALVPYAGRLGIDVLTGDDWAVLVGSRARFGALARPWVAPPALHDLATRIGLALPAEPPVAWRVARGTIALDRPVVVGILNLTPDSFSDGGNLGDLDAVRRHAERLVGAGAGVLDVGGESTRPGRTAGVPLDEELRRVVPAVEALVRDHPAVPVSIDTVKAPVARAALGAGAAIVNDVAAFRLDPAMAGVAAEYGAGVILMHSRGSITEIASYTHAQYDDVAADVGAELSAAVDRATAAGIAPDAIVLDPGFGFSKTAPQNLQLLDQLDALLAQGRPLLVGPSRKRFLGEVTGRGVQERDVATAAACALAYERGARLFRVHDVATTRDALALAAALDPTP